MERSAYEEFVRPEMGKVLRLLKLDKTYEKATGDTLYYSENSETRQVLDFLGGYGSTLLGHNHPEILSLICENAKNQIPQMVQGSIRKQTALLATELNKLILQNLGDPRRFVLTCTNSGTEAVEAALKHALLQWRTRFEKHKLGQSTQRFDEKLRPIMLSLKGAFHGKTAASLSVTHNPEYGRMYGEFPYDVVFLDPKQPVEQIEDLLKTFDVPSRDSTTPPFSRIAGFIFEPIQGEGGISPLKPSFMNPVADFLRSRKVPLIADEIQSGLYRTGKFLASEHLELKPDYILLGKSLGGGIAKIGAVLISDDHYNDRFGWIHTSTFAEDDGSSSVARKVLQILEREKEQIKNRALHFENWFRTWVEKIQARHPGLLKAGRGKGFMLGLEIDYNTDSPMPELIWSLYRTGHASYIFSSFLLNQFGLRVGVTLSKKDTLRLEPSVYISDEAMARLEKGLDALCAALASRQVLQLTSHLWEKDFSEKDLQTVSSTKPPRAKVEPGMRKIGFLSHVIDIDHARSLDAMLRKLPRESVENFFEGYASQADPFEYHEIVVKGANGQKVHVTIFGMLVPSSFFEQSIRQGDFSGFRKVQAGVDFATKYGIDLLGLGQFTSIVSGNGLLLNAQDLALTTGNSLTAGMAIRAIEHLAKEQGKSLADLRLGVVGFTGNICNVITQILGEQVRAVTLVYKEPFEESLRFQKEVAELLKIARLPREEMVFAHQPEKLADCDVVIVGTNTAQSFISSQHLKKGSIILDISVPSNVTPDVKSNPHFFYFQGGLAKMPFGQTMAHPWLPLPEGNWYACLAETIALGLNGVKDNFSLGKLSRESVMTALSLAEKAGISVGGIRRASEVVTFNIKSESPPLTL